LRNLNAGSTRAAPAQWWLPCAVSTSGNSKGNSMIRIARLGAASLAVSAGLLLSIAGQPVANAAEPMTKEQMAKDEMMKKDEMAKKEMMAKDEMMKKEEMAKKEMMAKDEMMKKEEMAKKEMMAKDEMMKKEEMMKKDDAKK
jgi:pentapeptide MXKDX repeat protein